MISQMTDEQFREHLHTFITEAKIKFQEATAQASGLSLELSALKEAVIKAEDRLLKIGTTILEAEKLVRGIGHSLNNRVPTELVKKVIDFKVILVLILMAILIGYTMRNGMTTIDKAIASMEKGNYIEAEKLWAKAAKEGEDFDLCMGRKAESIMRQGRYGDAIAACDDIDSKIDSMWTPFIRGQIFEINDKTKVQDYKFLYQEAVMRGNKCAALKLKMMEKQ